MNADADQLMQFGRDIDAIEGTKDLGDIKQGKHVNHNSDSEDGAFFDNEEDERDQIAQICDMNEDALILQVCKGVSDGEQLHYVVFPKN